MKLTTYWIEFDPDFPADKLPAGTKIGCGVSALDQSDAINLVCKYVFSNTNHKPKINRIITPVDITAIDKKHVLPNMGNLLVRGIWYPLGYAE